MGRGWRGRACRRGWDETSTEPAGAGAERGGPGQPPAGSCRCPRLKASERLPRSSLRSFHRFLEHMERLKPGPAPKNFLNLQAGVQQPNHQAALGPATAVGCKAINFVPRLHCLFWVFCFFFFSHGLADDQRIQNISLCFKGSILTLARTSQLFWKAFCWRVAAAGRMVVASILPGVCQRPSTLY